MIPEENGPVPENRRKRVTIFTSLWPAAQWKADPLPVVSITIFNLATLLLCLCGVWQVFDVFAIYWFEMAVVFLFAFAKIGAVLVYRARHGRDGNPFPISSPVKDIIVFSLRAFAMLAVSFAFFWFLSGFFPTDLFSNSSSGQFLFGNFFDRMKYGFLAIVLGYGYAFVFSFLVPGEYKNIRPVGRETTGFALMKGFATVSLIFAACFLSMMSSDEIADPRHGPRILFFVYILLKVYADALLSAGKTDETPDSL